MTAERPPFWSEKAQRLVGKHVLIGKTYVDERGEPVELVQLHGVVESADESSGIALRRSDNQELERLPPDLRPFVPAEPGEYRLRSTGEVVVDPDFLATWTIARERR